MKNILNNQNGHGYVPSGKELLKIGAQFLGIILTAPISIPVMIILDKRKQKKIDEEYKKQQEINNK